MPAERQTILIVDDDEIVRLIVAKVAERHGVAAVFARNGGEAQALLDQGRRFDAVFLDLIMPHLSGWDVLNAIQKDPATRGMPVVIVSGAPLGAAERRKLSLRAYRFVDKETFSLKEFEGILLGCLGRETPRQTPPGGPAAAQGQGKEAQP